MFPRMRSWVACIPLWIAFALPNPAHAQGFGVARKNAVLVRTVPPLVNLTDVRVSVAVTGVSGCRGPLTELLRVKVAALVFSNRTLAEDNQNPDRTIDINLTECSASGPTPRLDGTLQVKGTLAAAYRTIDNRTKVSLDSTNLTSVFDRNFPGGATPTNPNNTGTAAFLDKLNSALQQVNAENNRPPTLEQLATILAEHLAGQVSQRVVPTEVAVAVPLPKGELEQASDLGVAGRWGAMLERYEQTPALKGVDEAYRRYGIGVASEALAYAAADRGVQRDLIARASQEYKAALKLKPREGPFREAEGRIATSLTALDVNAATAAQGVSGTPVLSPPRGGTSNEWTNEAVVALAREGLKDSELADAIRSAPAVQFDISPNGLIQLKRGGVSETVIRAVRERVLVTGGSSKR